MNEPDERVRQLVALVEEAVSIASELDRAAWEWEWDPLTPPPYEEDERIPALIARLRELCCV